MACTIEVDWNIEFEKTERDGPIILALQKLVDRATVELVRLSKSSQLNPVGLSDASLEELSSMFAGVASLLAFDKVVASTHLSALQAIVIELQIEMDLLESSGIDYKDFRDSLLLLCHSLAYRATDKPFYRIPSVDYEADAGTWLASSSHPVIPGRLFLLEQRKMNNLELYPIVGRYDTVIDSDLPINEELDRGLREEYLYSNEARFISFEWETFMELVDYLTLASSQVDKYMSHVKFHLDDQHARHGSPGFLNGGTGLYEADLEDDNASYNGQSQLPASPTASGSVGGVAQDNALSALSSQPGNEQAHPNYPPLVSFTLPCTEEAMAAEHPADRRCYACYFYFGPVFNDEHMTEPAVRTECGHTHGAVCLENWLKAGESKCPVCRQELFGFQHRLTARGRTAYNTIMQTLKDVAELDEIIDGYLLARYKDTQDLKFPSLLYKLAELANRMARARSQLMYSVAVY